MSPDDEEDALTWAGGRDPSHYETPTPKAPKTGRAAKAPVSASAESKVDTEPEDAAATSAVVLIALGILGGVYLLYTVGWFVSWQRETYVDPNGLELAAFRIQQVLAILAPPLWFGATLYFTRARKPALRLLWLVAGALVLIPWSFTFGR